MPRTCLLLIAGLDASLLQRTPNLPTLSSLKHATTYKPVLPAVTSTIQATLTTGGTAAEHGIIANGLYTFRRSELLENLDLSNHADTRRQVSFWEQSNALLQRPRFWQGTAKKVAMLFWQNSINAADIVLTPKPTHTPDGKTLSACFSSPDSLYPALTEKFGPFPLHNYWSPLAGLPSSQWIINAAEYVWDHHTPDLQLVYIPHLDYNLQRLGPSHPQNQKDLADIDALLAPLAHKIRAAGHTLIIAGDYGMFDVATPVLPNAALRDAGLLATTPDPAGKLLVDYANSAAFTMVDHQLAHVYVQPGREADTLAALAKLTGIARILSTPDDLAAHGLNSLRSGEFVLLANPDAWFAHDWWLSDSEKPAWQFTVDIHHKPGFDPRELFFDPIKKTIAQDPRLVRGSHALTHDPSRWPVILSTTDLPSPTPFSATLLSPWLARLTS
ncbi:MAG TPA: alkaline phosphatase family protein [Phycisphaerae bacterium]|nr:alkaline phosphatase family protein [Phycisphaerae bacterium]